VCLVLCGCVCYFVNMGSACATPHATHWGMNTEGLTGGGACLPSPP